MRRKKTIIFLISFIFLYFFSWPLPVAAGSWTTTTVDSGGVGSNSSITTDAFNNYLISYNANGDSLLFAKSINSGSSWASSAASADWGGTTSIATDQSDNYLIAAMNPELVFDPFACFPMDMCFITYLKFTKSTDGGSNWSTYTVDTSGIVGQHTSITFNLNWAWLLTENLVMLL